MRAVAVLLVIAGHLSTYATTRLSLFSGGFIGVDVFFVLSGFLITSLMLREAQTTGRISLRSFYARRARRILPAATAALMVVLGACAVLLPTARMGSVTGDARWSAIFLANWHFSHVGTSYFDNTATSPLQHFWSLAVEEQFYLLWPLVLLVLVGRVRRVWLGVIVAGMCVASVAWAVYTSLAADPATRSAAYFSTPARAYELGLGALLAVVGVPAALSVVSRTLLATAGLLALAVATVRLGAESPFPGWEALIPTVATVALLVAGAGTATPVTRLLSVKPLRFVGDISYSLYLWHFPVIILAPFYLRSMDPGRIRVGIEVVLMFALAIASYYLVEQPVLRGWLASRILGGRALALWPAALALVLVGTAAAMAESHHRDDVRRSIAASWWEDHPHDLAMVTPSSAPATSLRAVRRELDRSLELADEGAPIPPSIDAAQVRDDIWGQDPRYGCSDDPRLAAACPMGDHNAQRTIAVVGDSHAAMWLPALDLIGQRDHIKIVRFTMAGCAPYRVYQPSKRMDQQTCDDFRDWTQAQLASLHPDTVLLAARGYLFLKNRDGQSIAKQWRDGVSATVSALRPLTDQIGIGRRRAVGPT